MLHHAKLDKCFWAEAAMTAIYVKNRLPSPKIEHKTPFEIVYKSKAECEAHACVRLSDVHFDSEGEAAQVGPQGSRRTVSWATKKCPRRIDFMTSRRGRWFISRDVNFDESTFGLSPTISDEDVDDWTSNRSTSTMMVPARRSTRRQGSARVARVTKMKLPEDRELCVIDLDWEEQVPPKLLPRTEQTQTKKKSMEMKMTIRLHPVCFGVQVPMPSKQAIYRSRRHSKKR
ncbi:hypothetical protein Pcac1_g29523 [Phytophthora cactorum]|nr:hypothetical protein Pcac1_g29523 [Phytophthora cactorum]